MADTVNSILSDKKSDKEEALFRNRISELAQKCFSRDIPCYTDFLTLREQAVFHSLERSLPPVTILMTGGYEAAERKMVCFLPSYMDENTPPPFVLLSAAPRDRRFSEPLTHRDFLGALMNLGIERECIGDLLIKDSSCFFYAAGKIADYVTENLVRVKHTEVLCERQESRMEIIPEFTPVEASVASLRLDSVLAAVFKTSRSHILPLIEGEKVFVNGRIITSPDARLQGGEIISCRGMGKVRFSGPVAETKKGRKMIRAELYK